MAIRINDAVATYDDVVYAVAVAAKTQVVACPQPADAASPVMLHAGPHSRQIGQSATYCHHVERAAEAHGAALVCGYWSESDQGWYVTVEGADQAQAEILRIARERTESRRRQQQAETRAQRDAADAAERETAAARRRAEIDRAVELVRVAAEAWAPGRIAIMLARGDEIIVGRWDAPAIPGHGMPDEVRRAVHSAADPAVPALVPCRESYRYGWGSSTGSRHYPIAFRRAAE